MALKPISRLLPPLPNAPSPIKGEHHPQPPPHLSRLIASSLPLSSARTTGNYPPPSSTAIAPPLRRRSCSGEHLSGSASPSLSSPTNADEHRRPRALVHLMPVKRRHATCPRHLWSTVDPIAPLVHDPMDLVHGIYH
jgi:hypothetical protein